MTNLATNGRVTRRTLLSIASTLIAGAGIHRALALQTSPLINYVGDCEPYPAATMLINFSTANFDKLPYRSLDEMNPRVNWKPFNTVELGPLFIPGTWTPVLGWANSFQQNGIPEWQPQQMAYPFWSLTAALSPDGSSAYLYVNGGIDNVFLTPEQGGQLACNTVVGSDQRPQEICQLQQTQQSVSQTDVNWTSGYLYDDVMFLTRGFSINSDVGGSSLGPGSSFGFDAMIAPVSQSEEMMHDVFIPILWQMVPKGGGAVDPTPTPTPSL